MPRLFPAFVPLLAAALLGGSAHSAQQVELLRINPPAYEAEAGRLRSQPAKPYEFSKAVLADVIRFMAVDAGINFFGLPEGSREGEQLVTFSVKASPFQALETLTKGYGLSLILEGGIWYVRPADDRELVGKAYEIKHNAMEQVRKNSTGSLGSPTGSSMGMQGGGGGMGSPFGGGQVGGGAGNVDLQGATTTFHLEKSELINDIRAILDLGSDGDAVSASMSPLSVGGGSDPKGGGFGSPTDLLNGIVRRPKVIWKSDSNTLYVVATRLQHMWVEGYLAAADKPQPQIAIEVKFIESSRDPSSELGLDWSGTLGANGTFRQLDSLTYDSNGQPTITSTAGPQKDGGFRMDMAPLQSIGNLNGALSAFANPWNSVLSAQDINVKLRAFLSDGTTKTTSYPRMVTTNNREVVIRSVVNQPVLGGSSSSSVGTGATTSSAISYLPIGTVINILPKKMENNKVNLNMSITVSSIIGTTVIQGNPYPIASSRVYSAPVEVDSGYTVAVGGLDEAKEQETDSGVPVLNKIPLLGYLFKSHSKSKNQKNLMLFITPKLIDSKDGGLSSSPESVLPRKPDRLMPQRPRLSTAGGIEGGIGALPGAIDFMRHSADEIGQIIDEGRGTDAERQKLNDLQSAVVRLEKVVDKYTTEQPQHYDELARHKNELVAVKTQISKHRRALTSKGYY